MSEPDWFDKEVFPKAWWWEDPDSVERWVWDNNKGEWVNANPGMKPVTKDERFPAPLHKGDAG